MLRKKRVRAVPVGDEVSDSTNWSVEKIEAYVLKWKDRISSAPKFTEEEVIQHRDRLKVRYTEETLDVLFGKTPEVSENGQVDATTAGSSSRKRGGPFYYQLPGETPELVQVNSVKSVKDYINRQLGGRKRIPKGTKIWRA